MELCGAPHRPGDHHGRGVLPRTMVVATVPRPRRGDGLRPLPLVRVRILSPRAIPGPRPAGPLLPRLLVLGAGLHPGDSLLGRIPGPDAPRRPPYDPGRRDDDRSG